MTWFKPIMLYGNCCTVEPLSYDHLDGLIEAVKDGELWNLWYTHIPEPHKMADEIARRLDLQEKQKILPFVTIDSVTGKVAGMTAYLNIDPINCRLEIGGTWNRKSVQRTGINTESKLLLLTHAFESMNCNAVEFRTHFHNHQSRRGIERIGAKFDGILRNHMIMPDKTLRDTCVYSIIANEWPTVKKHLHWLMNKPREVCV